MKSPFTLATTFVFLLVALALPAQLGAQQHPRYRIVDLGTLGGSHSYGSFNGDGVQQLNNAGESAPRLLRSACKGVKP